VVATPHEKGRINQGVPALLPATYLRTSKMKTCRWDVPTTSQSDAADMANTLPAINNQARDSVMASATQVPCLGGWVK
jgi:hypothetical protein